VRGIEIVAWGFAKGAIQNEKRESRIRFNFASTIRGEVKENRGHYFNGKAKEGQKRAFGGRLQDARKG
jgi:hypothetical protein